MPVVDEAEPDVPEPELPELPPEEPDEPDVPDELVAVVPVPELVVPDVPAEEEEPEAPEPELVELVPEEPDDPEEDDVPEEPVLVPADTLTPDALAPVSVVGTARETPPLPDVPVVPEPAFVDPPDPKVTNALVVTVGISDGEPSSPPSESFPVETLTSLVVVAPWPATAVVELERLTVALTTDTLTEAVVEPELSEEPEFCSEPSPELPGP